MTKLMVLEVVGSKRVISFMSAKDLREAVQIVKETVEVFRNKVFWVFIDEHGSHAWWHVPGSKDIWYQHRSS